MRAAPLLGLTLALNLTLSGCCIFEATPIEVLYPEGVTATGVHWRDTLTGLGAEARPQDHVVIHYTARVKGGAKIDSSHDRGEPEAFVLDAAPVLGWGDGIPGMRAGGKRWLGVPAARAFGDEGIEGLIPPGATLEFLIELLEVQKD